MDNIHGFKKLQNIKLPDIQSEALLFEHEKTKAKLIKIENEDDNKVFCIGFRTPPKDSTGVCHIIEHSVLNGSRKYRTREPFMDMVKSSLQTFLNAMTYPDKTIYPIASRNTKDFHHLMDVYLDAVFYPRMYENKNIFYQEGWHYQLDESNHLFYNGVVYNEMRGSYSSVDQQEYEVFSKLLYPDTCYAHSSGGDPYEIPQLTYEDFISYHKNFYSPSNSYIYLYGNGQIEEELEHINSYLNNFEYRHVESRITPQKPFEKVLKTTTQYAISNEEDPKGKDILMYGVNVGNKDDIRTYFTAELLGKVLFSKDSAIIKQSLIDHHLGEDITSMNIDGLEIGMGIISENTDCSRLDEFEKLIEEELSNIVKNGIQKDELRAVINTFEYNLREATGFPTKGIIYGINILDTWLYDKDPFLMLNFNEHLEFLRNAIDTDYYERFIEDKILNNHHKIVVAMEAVPGLYDHKDQKVRDYLMNYKNSLSHEEMEQIKEMNLSLQEFQNRVDTPEEKMTIPRLSISDVEKKLPPIEQIIEKNQDVTILKHPQITNKINYFSIFFDIENLGHDDLQYANLYAHLVGSLDTKDFTYQRLNTEIYLKTGGISTEINLAAVNPDVYRPKFSITTKCMTHQLDTLSPLLTEIFMHTNFSNHKRILELLKVMKNRMKSSIISSGHIYSLMRVHAMNSEAGAYTERIDGLSFYDFICHLVDHFDEKKEELTKRFEEIQQKMIHQNNLILSITSDRDDINQATKAIKEFVNVLDTKKRMKHTLDLPLYQKTLALKTSANVNYNIMGISFTKENFEYKGRIEVLNNLLSNGYLYSEIRAKGGAYGEGFNLNRIGNMQVYSYRDPKIIKTYETYQKLAQALREVDISDDELTQLKLGIVSKFNPPRTPLINGNLATSLYLTNRTIEEIENELADALDCTLEDLKEYAPLIEKMTTLYHISTVGNAEMIEENKEIFDEIKSLI